MQPQTERYLDLVRQGKNQWWRYLAAVLVILLFGQVLGTVPFLLLARGGEFNDLLNFTALNLGVLVELAGLVIAVRLIHRRSMLSLITPRPAFDWRRAAHGFAAWFLLVAASALIEGWLFPGRYRLSFNADSFFLFAAVVLCLTPLQAATEELLFRGYLMQALGLFIRRPALIAVLSSLLFALPHLANPEVAHGPLLIPLEYLAIGLLLAVVTLRDGRLELAIGIHAANNVFGALVANYEGSVLTTEAIFTATLDPAYSLAALLAASAVFYLMLFGPRSASLSGTTR